MDNTVLILVGSGITIMLQLINSIASARYNQKQFELYLQVFTRITALETQMEMLLPQHNHNHKKDIPG